MFSEESLKLNGNENIARLYLTTSLKYLSNHYYGYCLKYFTGLYMKKSCNKTICIFQIMNIHAYLHFAVSLSKTPELIHGLNYGCRITPAERWNCFDVNYTKNYTNNHTLSILSLKQLRLFVAKLIPSCIFIPRISVWNINVCQVLTLEICNIYFELPW